MKKLFILISAIVLAAGANAQSPQKMSYQAVVRDTINGLVSNQTVGMQISVLQGSINGSAIYVETQEPTTNNNGLVSIEIGAGVTSDYFSTIDWSTGSYFIKTEIDPIGGFEYTITGTSQLLSVPYALHANTADSIIGGISIVETDPVYVASIANGITALDTARWNNHTIDMNTQLDSSDIAVLGYVAGNSGVNDILTEDNDAEGLTIVNVGAIGIGTSTPNPGAALEIKSTTGAFLLPRMTTAERDAITAEVGMMIFNTTSYSGQLYSGPPETVDQEQTLNNGEGSEQGQSFTAGTTGDWTKLKLLSSETSTGTLNIYEGEGMGGNLIHTQSISFVSWEEAEIVLTSPVPVISGQQYTFETDITLRYSTDEDSYPTGTMYFQTAAAAGDLLFEMIVGGSSWVDID